MSDDEWFHYTDTRRETMVAVAVRTAALVAFIIMALVLERLAYDQPTSLFWSISILATFVYLANISGLVLVGELVNGIVWSVTVLGITLSAFLFTGWPPEWAGEWTKPFSLGILGFGLLLTIMLALRAWHPEWSRAGKVLTIVLLGVALWTFASGLGYGATGSAMFWAYLTVAIVIFVIDVLGGSSSLQKLMSRDWTLVALLVLATAIPAYVLGLRPSLEGADSLNALDWAMVSMTGITGLFLGYEYINIGAEPVRVADTHRLEHRIVSHEGDVLASAKDMHRFIDSGDKGPLVVSLDRVLVSSGLDDKSILDVMSPLYDYVLEEPKAMVRWHLRRREEMRVEARRKMVETAIERSLDHLGLMEDRS